MAHAKSDLLQGTLDMLILKVVAEGPVHGYAISKRIRRMSNDVLHIRQGSLYPALHRLEERKLLQAEWRDADSGREAKFYRLTAVGHRELAAETESWARLSVAIGLVMGAAGA